MSDEESATDDGAVDDTDGTTADDRNLALLVRKPDADRIIEALRMDGSYDDDRRIQEADADHLEIPITDQSVDIDGYEVIQQTDPEPRITGLSDRLRERGWTSDELALAPSSWAVVGRVVFVRFDDCPREAEVGEALLELHGEADTVLAREGITGAHREPTVRVVAGAGDTETVHTEHGTRYALDLAQVMFSPGNEAERVRMGRETTADERVLDMFAGIGYFALPIARAGGRVTAIERNPVAFRYLLENAVLNDVEERIDAYRADCADVAPTVDADRIVMGYYDAPDYLEAALAALEPEGIVHLHATTPESAPWEHPVERLEAVAGERGRAVEVLDRRRVKSHSAGIWHVVVDARIG